MNRIALLVAIDAYPLAPLAACVSDAHRLSELLSQNADHTSNFHCKILANGSVTRAALRQAIISLFENKDVEISLLYFAGHGLLRGSNPPEGILQTVDGIAGDEGISMEWILGQANSSMAKERVVVLDCCHAGAIDQLFAGKSQIFLREGTSVIAASRSEQAATEMNGSALFSSLVCAALEGGAADVRGFVTAAGIYAYVDQIMTPWDQRPLFKTNAAGLSRIRRANHAVTDDDLRELTNLFPTPDYEYPLTPEYEWTHNAHKPELGKILDMLQRFRAARLVEPVGSPHMYFAAMKSKSCRLLPLGRAYWQQVRNRLF